MQGGASFSKNQLSSKRDSKPAGVQLQAGVPGRECGDGLRQKRESSFAEYSSTMPKARRTATLDGSLAGGVSLW
jgi:hypothetical protein